MVVRARASKPASLTGWLFRNLSDSRRTTVKLTCPAFLRTTRSGSLNPTKWRA
jgi:hypothetical protein